MPGTCPCGTQLIAGRAEELLRNATLPENLWPEALRLAVYLKNRSPTTALKFEITPSEKVHGIRPDFSRQYPWGCRVYVTYPPAPGS
jgi:hypothetical protein